jgi:hypothetical protein
MLKKSWTLGSLAVVVLAIAPIHGRAQEGVRVPVEHQHLISGNPLLLLAEWFNAEYETKLSETFTVGGSGGWLNLDNADYTNLAAFTRYYPQGAALVGFYLGGRFGIHNVESGDDSGSAFGFGIDLGYTWLLGPSRSFYIGLGMGATRLFGLDVRGASTTLPTVRLINIGIAF